MTNWRIRLPERTLSPADERRVGKQEISLWRLRSERAITDGLGEVSIPARRLHRLLFEHQLLLKQMEVIGTDMRESAKNNTAYQTLQERLGYATTTRGENDGHTR